MRVLTVFAHPDRQSFCGAVFDRFTRGLTEAGHDVEVADLYAEGFDPVFNTYDGASALGAILMAGGLVWMIAGAVQLALGRSLSALPSPTKIGSLVDTGAFALVRHPMYCGAIWAASGCGLWNHGLLTLGYAALLTVFFDLKATREEHSLEQRFLAYRDYRRRVRKLIPFCY